MWRPARTIHSRGGSGPTSERSVGSFIYAMRMTGLGSLTYARGLTRPVRRGVRVRAAAWRGLASPETAGGFGVGGPHDATDRFGDRPRQHRRHGRLGVHRGPAGRHTRGTGRIPDDRGV